MTDLYKRVRKYLPLNIEFMAAVIIVVAFVAITFLFFEKNRLFVIERSFQGYMNTLKDMIFMSTYDSLKKGNMNTFRQHLEEIGKYQYVKEFSLLNPDGVVRYSSNPKNKGKIDGAVDGLTESKVNTMKDYATYYFPVPTIRYCTRCHIEWKEGSINSYYKVSLSKAALNSVRLTTIYSYILIIISALLVMGFVYLSYKVIEKRRAEEIIRKSEKKYRAIFENMLDVHFQVDKLGYLKIISPSGVKLLEYESELDMLGRHIQEFYYRPSEWGIFLDSVIDEKEVVGFESVMKKHNGTPVIVEMGARKLTDSSNAFAGVEGVFRDITERKANEEQIQLMASVFENTIEGIVITDPDGYIESVNPAFSGITGYPSHEVVGRNPNILKSGVHDVKFYREMWNSLVHDGQWSGEIWNKSKSGEKYPAWLSINAIKDSYGVTIHYVGVFHDITDIKQSEEQLRFQAYHDVLTGLPNRKLFIDRLEMALAYAQRHEQKVAVLFLDLDNFKNINDTVGHQMGDEFLKAIAGRISGCCREQDTVARLGGDEFTVILPDVTDKQSVNDIADRIIKSVLQPVNIQGHDLQAGTSIGITFYPDDGENVETLVKNADMAMYRAKEVGKGDYAIYTNDMNEALIRKLNIERNISGALSNGEFRLYYQPIVDLKTGAVTGLESLIRWQKSEHELISPADFIPVAETSDLIYDIGEWGLMNACSQMNAWQKSGFEDIYVAVNLSARQFQSDKLIDMVSNTLRETGLPAKSLVLEITENAVVSDVDAAIETMSELNRMGVKISMDDFGTGYSSLSYLKRFPIDILKIDRTFVKDVPYSKDDVLLVQAILSLAKSMNLKSVAEGVESKSQLDFLIRNMCNSIQGYYFSKPLPAHELTKMLIEGRFLRIQK